VSTTGRIRFPTLKPLVTRLDRLPLPAVVALGVVLGGGIGGVGFVHGEGSGWLIFWPALFAAIGWLGYTAAPVFAEAALRTPRPAPRRVLDGGLPMVELPGGDFLMGSPASDDMARGSERPQHPVTLAPFRMAVTPVTAGLYRAVMAQPATGEDERAARLPVGDVSWFDAVEFCNRLSIHAGYRPCYSRIFGFWRCNWHADGYRLPTEAEWEYACRAGTTSRYSFGDDPAALDGYAWFAGNANGEPQPVATKRANAWGLYDMHGNVWEWCWDWFGSYSAKPVRNPHGPLKWRAGRRVVRGGSFNDSPEFLRSASRGIVEPAFRNADRGFRCVRVPPQPLEASTA